MSSLQNKRNKTPQDPPWSQGFLFQVATENIPRGRLSCKDRNMLLLSEGRQEQQDTASLTSSTPHLIETKIKLCERVEVIKTPLVREKQNFHQVQQRPNKTEVANPSFSLKCEP